MPSLKNISSLDQYFTEFGSSLGRKADVQLDPLHIPGVHEHGVASDEFLQRQGSKLSVPLDPQSHCIAAIRKTLMERRNVFLVGEMGTGKSLIGACSVHKHAAAKPYRAIVVCPDHLITNWCDEIAITIPNAKVTSIRAVKDWPEILKLADLGRRIRTDGGKHGHKRWAAPDGPEWLVVGVDQIKRMGAKVSAGEGPNATACSRTVRVRHDAVLDSHGHEVREPSGNIKWDNEYIYALVCPRCGGFQRTSKGALITREESESSKALRVCERVRLHQESVRPGESGLDVVTGSKGAKINGQMYVPSPCNEPLWQYTATPRWWSTARLIQKKLKGLFRYCILDEVHESKSADTARAIAAIKVATASKYTIAMTGTIIGGRADHLFPLLMRFNARSLKAEGFEWGDVTAFVKEYGVMETVVTTRTGDTEKGKSSRSLATRVTTTTSAKPGIMPHLFGRQLMGCSLFIGLDEMYESLPKFEPILVPVTMDQEVSTEYGAIAAALERENKALMQKGSMKLLSTMHHTLMRYPDQPYGWLPRYEGKRVVGYYAQDPKCKDTFIGVVNPSNLSLGIRPKEQRLVDICKKEKSLGNQCWVFAQMTGTRDVIARLEGLLSSAGLRVKVMRTGVVKPVHRKEWIEKHGPGCDVMISNPELVKTGLTFFARDLAHNFSSIVFYQTGYNLFTLRQAARRAWRLGQPKDCRVYFLYYRGTIQEGAMVLMGTKLAAAEQLDGKFSSEGLVEMASAQGTDHMALAKTIDGAMGDLHRNWAKFAPGADAAMLEEDKEVAPPEEDEPDDDDYEWESEEEEEDDDYTWIAPIPGTDLQPISEPALVPVGQTREELADEFAAIDWGAIASLASYLKPTN